MPRESSKCREWEKDRRNRLNEGFTTLCKLLPNYDPSINTSKLDILRNAATYIEELQTKIKDLLSTNSEDSVKKVKGEEYKKLQERVRRLLGKNELLCSLLREAKIAIPPGCSVVKRFKYPNIWSNKILPDQAKILQKKESEKENDASVKKVPRKFSGKKQNKVGGQNSAPKHRKAILNRSDSKKPRPKKKKAKPLTPSKCVIVLSQPSITQPCYVITNASSNNILGGTSTVITNSGLVTNPLVSSKTTKTVSSIPPLGPGTLILADGTIMPVLPQQTVLPLAPQIITRPPIILLKNSVNVPQVSKVSTGKTLTRIRPKYCLTKTTQVNKVPIPALTSRYSNVEVVLKKPEAKTVKVPEKKTVPKEAEKVVEPEKRKAAPPEETTEAKKAKIVENEKEPTEPPVVPSIQTDPVESSDKGSKTDEVIEKDKPTEEVSKSTEPEVKKPEDTLDLNINHSELSNDIFASLQVPAGCQNPESTSPTAAFLLAFPLVSSLTGVKVTEVTEEDNTESQRGTPTLLQIGTMDSTKPTQSETSLLNLDNLSFFSSKDIGGFYNSFEGSITTSTTSTVVSTTTTKSGINENDIQKKVDYQRPQGLQQPRQQTQTQSQPLQPQPQQIRQAQQSRQQQQPQAQQTHQQQQAQPTHQQQQPQAQQTHQQQQPQPTHQQQQPQQTHQQQQPQPQQTHQQQQSQQTHQQQQPQQTHQQQPAQQTHQQQQPQPQQARQQQAQSKLQQTQQTIQQQPQQTLQSQSQSQQTRQQPSQPQQKLHQPQQPIQQSQQTLQPQQSHQQQKPQQTLQQQSQAQQSLQQQTLQQPHHQEKNQLVPCFDNHAMPTFGTNGTTMSYQPKSSVGTIDSKQQPVCANTYNQKHFTSFNTTCSYNIKSYPEPLYTNSTTYTYSNTSDSNFNQNYYKDIKSDNRSYYSLNYENYADYRKNDSNTYFPSTNYYSNAKFNTNTSSVQKTKNSTQSRPPINWMTTPDNRLQTPTDYVLPQFTKEPDFYPSNTFTNTQTTYFNTNPMYSTNTNEVTTNNERRKSLDLSLVPPVNTYQRNEVEDNQFSWSPTKIPQFLDPPHSFVSSTLPTLVGDLALGNTLPFGEQKGDKCQKKDARRLKNYEGSGNQSFLSVSQLVDHNKEVVPARTTTRRNSGNRSSGKKVPPKTSQRKETKEVAYPQNNKVETPGKGMKQLGYSGGSTGDIFCDSPQKNRVTKNSYSAEALIGHQMQNDSQNKPRQQNYNNKPISVSSLLHDNIISYFPPVDLPQDNTYIQQNQNYQTSSFSHNFPSTFQNNTYTANTFIPTTTISSTYNFMHDVPSHDYSDLFPPMKEKNCGKGVARNAREQQCPPTPKKSKRKHSNDLPGFVDFPFLSMTGSISSPILPDDFHTHTGFLQPTPQLYPCKNPFTKPNDLGSGSLLPIPPVPVTRSNIQHPEISPINSAGTSLTNFNLSTIFPEINNKGGLDAYSDGRVKENPRYTSTQVSFNDKPTFSFSYINCTTSQTYSNQ